MNNVWKFFYNNKTKITGCIIVGIGAVQAQAGLITEQALLSPRGYAWFSIVAGVIVAVLGFLNSHKPLI